MATNRNLVFSYILDIKDFLTKNRQVTQEIGSLRQKATEGGQAIEQYGQKISSSGEKSAAAAVQFQTATQGMLNLSTAAVQTFTSISNLDRAANRLAQARVAEARAQDLLANKELRLQELQAKGLGNTQKAALLTNEIATARADLAVKTDKLRIEEGALTDVQLLFVSNIANVMISSLQTIKTLKDLNIVSNVRLLLTEKNIFGMGVRQNAQRLASIPIMRGTAMATNMMANANRTLMLTLGPIGIAIAAVTVGMEAYNNNWLGFRDALQSVFPFLKETNNELDESARILEEDRNAALGYANAIGQIENALDKLDTPYRDYLVRMRDAAKLTGNLNLELEYQAKLLGQAKVGVGFSSPSMGGLPTGQTTAGQTTGNTYTQSTQTTAGTSYTTTASAGTATTGTGTAVVGTSPVSPNYPDPFGTGLQQIRFKQLNIKEQYDQLLLLAATEQNTGRFGAAGAYLDKALEIREEALKYEAPKDTGPYAIPVSIQEAQKSSFRGLTNRERLENLIDKIKAAEGTATRSDARLLAYYITEELKDEIKEAEQNMENVLVSGSRRIGYAGIGGKTIAAGIYDQAFFGQGTAGMGRRVVDTPMMRALEQQQLEYQARFGPKVTRPKTNVDFQRMYLEMTGLSTSSKSLPQMVDYINRQRYITNAEDLASYGAVSTLGTNYAARTRFGAAAVSAGMVSVSEVVGGAARFAQRNAQAIAARKAEIAEEDAWRNSVEGQLSMLANALLTGGTFAFSSRVARSLGRYGGGLSAYSTNVIRAAGLLGVSVPYEGFKTTANEVFTGASAGLAQIIKENGVREEFLFAAMNAISETSRAAVQRTIPYGFSAIRNQLAAYQFNQRARNMTATGLQNYVSRVAAGNFGIYDATVLNAMTGATVSEYTSEISDFNSKIAPLLNIAHSDFKTTLVDPKRGINEIDDRIRWTQRLEQISTGATVF